MNAVSKKLNSKAGISLAIALVFFLLCAMVGTVVLSAASASAGSTARERQLYRETAALTSAAELLSRDIQGMTFIGAYTRTETVTTTVTGADQPSTTVSTEVKYRQDYCKLEGSKFFYMRKEMANYTGNLILNDLFFSKQGQAEWNAPANLPKQSIKFSAVAEQNIPEVTGTVAVGEDYTITMVLQCGENSLTMAFRPQATSKTEVAQPSTTRESDAVTNKITVTTYSTTIGWEQPVMQEGGTGND